MKNQVIELSRYRHQKISYQYADEPYASKSLRCWLLTIADTIMTLSVSVCTVFCMYLAYTML